MKIIEARSSGELVTVKLPPDVMNRSATVVLTDPRPFPTLLRETVVPSNRGIQR